MKIKDNKKYQRIFCAPKTESFCGFQSQENPYKFGFSVPENLRRTKKVFSACKFLQTSKSKDFDSHQKLKIFEVSIK